MTEGGRRSLEVFVVWKGGEKVMERRVRRSLVCGVATIVKGSGSSASFFCLFFLLHPHILREGGRKRERGKEKTENKKIGSSGW